MPGLPVAGWHDVLRVLKHLGYEFNRQKGSHIILVRTMPTVSSITVPKHKEIAPGTLRAIVRQSGLSVDEFSRLLRE